MGRRPDDLPSPSGRDHSVLGSWSVRHGSILVGELVRGLALSFVIPERNVVEEWKREGVLGRFGGTSKVTAGQGSPDIIFC
jgi:hypothetical protein